LGVSGVFGYFRSLFQVIIRNLKKYQKFAGVLGIFDEFQEFLGIFMYLWNLLRISEVFFQINFRKFEKVSEVFRNFRNSS
jgi:hypothetical protein